MLVEIACRLETVLIIFSVGLELIWQLGASLLSA